MSGASYCHPGKSSFRCRRCRHNLLQEDTAEVEAGCSLCMEDEAQSPVWYLQEENVPPWIQHCIEEACWTRGKLSCPKCGGRLGSFDFTVQSKCGSGLHVMPCVHLVRSRVDRFSTVLPVAKVKPFPKEETASISTPDEMILNSKTFYVLDNSIDLKQRGPTDSYKMNSCTNFPLSSEDSCGKSQISSECDHLQDNVSFTDRLGRCVRGRENIKEDQCCKQSSISDAILLEMLNTDVEESRRGCQSLKKDENGRQNQVQYNHHTCLSSSLHSSDTKKLTDSNCLIRDKCSHKDVESHPTGGDSAPEDNCTYSDTSSQILETLTMMNSGESISSGRNVETNNSTPTTEEAPLPSFYHEDSDDFLNDWDLLEELDNFNSSLVSPVPQTKAEIRRERNRRKKERRKLYKRGNCLSSNLDQDIKGIPPATFEEVTGLSLGDRTVQEYTVCAVCLDLFYNPRACTPCGHLFCEQCLRQLTRFQPTSTPCPLCRTVIQCTIPHESLNNALRKLFPAQTKQRKEAQGKIKQVYPLPRTRALPSVWLPLFSQQILSGRNRRRTFWSFQPNSTLDYHDFGRLWVQTLRWRFTVAGYGLLALLLVCACSVLVINFV